MLRILRYIHRKLLIESVLVLMASSVVATMDEDPTSDKALKEEQVFLEEIERNAFTKHEDLSKTSTRPTAPVVSLEDNSKKNPILLDNPSKPNMVKKTVHPLKEQKNDPVISPQRSIAQQNQKKTREKEAFAGCYGGVLGGTSHRYAEANLYSLGYKPIMPHVALWVDDSEINTMFYRSYSYNNNSYLLNGALFLGYDFHVTRLFRLGFEFQGEMEWRKMELSSNGVSVDRKEGQKIVKREGGRPELIVLPKAFTYENKTWDEYDFGYVRQTIQMPYNFSFIPRIGIAISKNSLIYTKLGVMYGPVEITDHPETIDHLVTEKSKEEKDTIYNNARPSVIGGIGFETTITKQLFLRMECLYSPGPSIKLDKDVLQDSKNHMNKNRQLEKIDIKSIKNFSIGLGAGVRF